MASPDSIPDRHAEDFLTSLAEQPFIALVFEGGETRLFTKGLDDVTMAKVAGLIEQITASRSA